MAKVNKLYKAVNDMFTYELVMFATAFFATAAVGVFGVTVATVTGAVVAPVAAGVLAYKYGL